jgi:hypothetical protein
MHEELVQAMSVASTKDLFDIIHRNRSEYSAEAVLFAEEELRKRNLEPKQILELQARDERIKILAVQPLTWPIRIALFICGFGLMSSLLGVFGLVMFISFGIPLIILVEIVYKEFDLKRRQAWQWMGYGFLSAIVALIWFIGIPLVITLFSGDR